MQAGILLETHSSFMLLPLPYDISPSNIALSRLFLIPQYTGKPIHEQV